MSVSFSSSLSTVSWRFIEDWLDALRGCYTEEQLQGLLRRAGLNPEKSHSDSRVTLDQIVSLYQIAAVESRDEMMGLWSRPIRPRALQHLLTSIRVSDTLGSALYRFSTFWNLLLDDYRFETRAERGKMSLSLLPYGSQPVQRFGHMLTLKLAHGLLSWLAGYEVRVDSVQFAFPRPDFAVDYAVIFPARVTFAAASSTIVFEVAGPDRLVSRSKSEVAEFLSRAPRDWIFTGYRTHAWSLLVREFLSRSNWEDCRLVDAAAEFRKTPRTLMRLLDAEGVSFQAIKDRLRCDIAIHDLSDDQKSIEQISQELGFSSAANFHRAFLRWTGSTPGAFRQSGAANDV
ncbi:AraC family transcriptional regulator ligand-binding domain-containing protein [Sinirhodobacter sp. HNIBRBA609]|nr:AraC family transcriptional regulator [Sedimentimonas flavescens]WBL32858.1 AraC family transcriptional regulator ligand-binding domain-containing protein [Sinirhodobacter sp. HNIBRBA609]